MKKLFLLAGVTAMLAGCYPNDPNTVDQYDLTLTNYDSTYNFKAATTFAISPNVVVITTASADTTKPPTYVKEPYNTQIINALSSNLTSRGWTEVASTADPDVLILPSAAQTTTIQYWYGYGGYWNWWYGGYYGWYYPGYYPTYTTTYTTGTLMVQMVDPKNVTPDNELPVRWLCLINGLLTGSSTQAQTTTRINTTINQAFTQSPYLSH